MRQLQPLHLQQQQPPHLLQQPPLHLQQQQPPHLLQQPPHLRQQQPPQSTAAAAAATAASTAAASAAAAAADPAAAAAADPAAAATVESTPSAAAGPAVPTLAEPAATAAAVATAPALPCPAATVTTTFITYFSSSCYHGYCSCHATAPDSSAASTLRSQWQTRDAHARFAIRNSLPLDEREHFGQCKTAKELYTAVVARYSSPASATLGRLSLPYLFPDLASFHTVADLITHLKTSEARFRAAMPAEFLASNPPPLWLTLYHIVTRLPDSLRSVRDSFLARSPTELTIALLEKDLLAAEASIVAVGASRGEPRTPFFEGCSPSPLLPSVATAAAVDLLGAEKVGAASASSGRRKSRGGKGGGGGGGGGGGDSGGGGGSGEASGGSGGGDSGGGGGGRGGGGSGGGGGRGRGRVSWVY
ncbi:unnamed protein product [Closterium sp. Yama58-4]|nr:unnamed protein product [Closterium sp. Yama58-4]